MRARATDPSTGLLWSLLPAAAALPWLLAPLGQPWVFFHAEWLVALVWLAVALWWTLSDRTGPAVPPMAWLFASLAAVPPVQAALGRLDNLSQALVPTLYLLAVALAIVVGASAPARRLLDALLAACLLAAVASTGLALVQSLHVDWGVLTPHLAPGQRPVANLGQPNNLATLLLWGLVALWWAWDRRKLGAPVATLAAAWLGLGLVLTQSRTGALGLCLLAVLAALRPADPQRPADRRWLAAAVLLFFALWLGWASGSDGPSLQGPRSLDDSVSAGKRPAIWAAMLSASWLHPWFGHGFGQTRQAHLSVIDGREPLHVLISYAHNLPLDLAVWAGWPIAVVVTGALAAWGIDRGRRSRSDGTRIPLAALAVFGLHAMLELPHAYLYFVVPAGLLVGAVDQQAGAARRYAAGRWPLAAVLTVCLALALQLAVEYAAVRADLQAYRFRAARIGTLEAPPPPRVWLLSDLQSVLASARVPVRAGMPPAELGALVRGTDRWPSDVALFRAAQALALNGQPVQAQARIERLCRIYPQAVCGRATAAWDAWQAASAAP